MCVCVCIHTYVYICMPLCCKCVFMCLGLYAYALCGFVSMVKEIDEGTFRIEIVNAVWPVYVRSIHTYKHTYMHTYIHTRHWGGTTKWNSPIRQACIHTYKHTYMHTYIHTYTDGSGEIDSMEFAKSDGLADAVIASMG